MLPHAEHYHDKLTRVGLMDLDHVLHAATVATVAAALNVCDYVYMHRTDATSLLQSSSESRRKCRPNSIGTARNVRA